MSAQPRNADQATQIQQSIARIHEACQAPALAPAEYRVLFDAMAQEITANGLQGAQYRGRTWRRRYVLSPGICRPLAACGLPTVIRPTPDGRASIESINFVSILPAAPRTFL